MLGQFKRFEIARKLPGEHIKCQYCDKDLETYVWLLQPYQIRLCQKCTQKLSPVVFVENNEEISELVKKFVIRFQDKDDVSANQEIDEFIEEEHSGL